ncbi:hypothetical protein TNCV_4512511 [Trichonephila clavipes]|nr:hypothetical protein TNCV_4512511 [Trichonephila clavipes]
MASAFSRSNPIENVWDALGRQVAGRNYALTNKNTLIRALTEELDKLPQQLLDNVVQSMDTKRKVERTKPSPQDYYSQDSNGRSKDIPVVSFQLGTYKKNSLGRK